MASGAMFQELSSRLATAHDDEPDKTDAAPKKSPQLPKKPPPPQKPQPPQKPSSDKIRSNTTVNKGKTVRITIDADEEKRQTIGPMPSGSNEEDNESPKKKHGVWKGIKRFFGKKKDRKSMRGNRKKGSKDENLSNQLRAKSESELPHGDSESPSKSGENKLKNSRYSWSEGLENNDDQKGGSPTDEDSNNEKAGGGLQKIRDSFRNRFKLKKKRSDGGSESCDSSVTSEKPVSYADLDTNFFDDSFYTASLSADRGAPLPEADNVPDDFPPSTDLSPLSTSNAARHKINIAPKSRRKPARFRHKEETSSSTDLKTPREQTDGDSLENERPKPVKEPIKEESKPEEALAVVINSHKTSRTSVDKDTTTADEPKDSLPLAGSSSLEQLSSTEVRRPIPAPRPRPKSLGPGIITGEKPSKQDHVAVEITVTKSPASKKKVLPEIPKSKSTGDVTTGDLHSSSERRKSDALRKLDSDTSIDDSEDGKGGVNSAAGTPQSISSDWEHINCLDSPIDRPNSLSNVKESNHTSKSTAATSIHTDKPADEVESEEKVEKPEEADTKTVEKSVAHVSNEDIGVIKSSTQEVRSEYFGTELTTKSRPPDLAVFKVSSPKQMHAAEVAAIRANRAACADTGEKPTSPIYDQPVVFKKRQWSSMKSKKSDMVDFRSIDIDAEAAPPSRSYSVSSRQSNSVKSKSFEKPGSDSEEGNSGKELPDWIKIARLKHQKHVPDETEDNSNENESKSSEKTKHHKERKMKLQHLEHLINDLDKIIP